MLIDIYIAPQTWDCPQQRVVLASGAVTPAGKGEKNTKPIIKCLLDVVKERKCSLLPAKALMASGKWVEVVAPTID